MKATSSDTLALVALWLIIPVAYVLQGQDANWDLRNYHLYNTISLFEGSFQADTAPAGIQSYFNPLASLPAYWIHRLAGSPDRSFWAGLGLAGFQGLCGPLLYGIARTLQPFPRLVAVLACGLGLTSPILLSEAGTTFADLTLCVLQLFAVLLCCQSIAANQSRKLWLIAIAWGVMGAACGIKFTCIFILPVLVMLTLAALIHKHGRLWSYKWLIQTILAIIFPLFISFCLFGWLWLSRSWADHGNPFFPIFSSLFGDSPLFYHDNHNDKRFIANGLSGFLLAAFQEFEFRYGLRAEVAYRDLRPLLWVYGGTLSLVAFSGERLMGHFAGFRTNATRIPQGWLALLVGMLASYGIWLKAAGIARYALPIQAMSGISLWVSLNGLVKSLQHGASRQAELQTWWGRLQRRWLSLLFAILVPICVATQIVPSWQRTDFGTAWNSLRPLSRDGKTASESQIVVPGKLFPVDRPVVLLSQPLGWLKQYAPTSPSFHLIIDNMRPFTISQIKTEVRKHGNHFTAVDLVDNPHQKLIAQQTITLLNGLFSFQTADCTDYGLPIGEKIRVCSAQLLAP